MPLAREDSHPFARATNTRCEGFQAELFFFVMINFNHIIQQTWERKRHPHTTQDPARLSQRCSTIIQCAHVSTEVAQNGLLSAARRDRACLEEEGWVCVGCDWLNVDTTDQAQTTPAISTHTRATKKGPTICTRFWRQCIGRSASFSQLRSENRAIVLARFSPRHTRMEVSVVAWPGCLGCLFAKW